MRIYLKEGLMINLVFLEDVLSTVLEVQYLDNQDIEAYKCLVSTYKIAVDAFAPDIREQYLEGLQYALQYALNATSFDYNTLMLDSAMHCFASQEEARGLFEEIWKIFFGEIMWADFDLVSQGEVVNKPIWKVVGLTGKIVLDTK